MVIPQGRQELFFFATTYTGALFMRKTKFSSVLLASCAYLSALTLSGAAFSGDTYTPPSSPELYEKEPAEGPTAKIRSKVYAGFNLGIGQSQSAGQSGARSAYLLNPKLGYNKVLSTWSLLDVDFSLLGGEFGYSRADVRANYGAMLRVGYGYSLGNHLFGVWKVGVGLFNADYTWRDNGYKAKGHMGTLLQGAFEVLFPLSSGAAVTGGVQWNHFLLSINDVKGDGQAFAVDRDEHFNVFSADVGIRFYL